MKNLNLLHSLIFHYYLLVQIDVLLLSNSKTQVWGFLCHQTYSRQPFIDHKLPYHPHHRVRVPSSFLTNQPVKVLIHVLHNTRNSNTCGGDSRYNHNKETKHQRRNNHIKKQQQQQDQQGEKTVVILYHKPKGVITSHSNTNDALPSNNNNNNNNKRCTVYEDIESMKGYIPTKDDNKCTSTDNIVTSFRQVTGIKSKLHAIGRLDADTTGLLLLTNDGQLVHHVTNPTASSSKGDKMVKVYHALIMGYHTLNDGDDNDNQDDNDNDNDNISSSTQLKKLLNGVDIGKKYGGMTQPPHELKVINHPTPKSTLVRIAISEGKNRQVRRMFHAIRSGVMNLHRVSIGNIHLDMLHNGNNNNNRNNNNDDGFDSSKEGQWRLLTDKEILDGLGWKVNRQLGIIRTGETIGGARKRSRRGSRSSNKNRRRSQR